MGDVLKTGPFDGYWGCAVALTARDKIDRMDPFCHIGITTVVLGRDYDFGDLDTSRLEILRFDRESRVAPDTYVVARRQTCIGIYSRNINPSVHVIGNIDVSHLVPVPLAFEAGNGADGGWPLCGCVSPSLGSEAIHAWRAIHDRAQLLKERSAGRKSHEEMLARLKARDAEKRAQVKARKRGR